jgi:endoglucanase
MHYCQRLLLWACPLTVVALAACQSAPLQPAPTPEPPMPSPQATLAPTALPSGEHVTLGPVTDQALLVNQVGYLPGNRKLGLVSAASGTEFQVVDTTTSRSVYAAYLSQPIRDPDTGQALRKADFTSVTQPGSYTLVVPGLGRSPEFRIGHDVYAALASDVLASYEELAVRAPQEFHSAGAKERVSGRPMDVSGGWPDAGDYGRYMPSAAGAMGTLLLLEDLYPERAATHEVLRRELDWMLKMQRADGAVYHKVTPLKFGGFNKGSDLVGGELFVFDPSTPDAAVFAAVMAQAARAYRSVDTEYADRMLMAAEKSWGWLRDNPRPMLPAELEGTGGYQYSGDTTQRFWAAAELFNTTGRSEYEQYVRAYLSRRLPSIDHLGWDDATTFALLSLLFDEQPDPELRAQLQRLLISWADGMATTIDSPINPWAISLSSFRWASNKTALNNSVLLLLAYRIRPSPRYVEAALDQLHYVLGRNALGKSYVTGYGHNSVKNPHTRTTFALGRLVPGVLVGGPNGDGQDGITPPAQGQRSYVDDVKAYASNENSIEYNAPLVFVAAYFAPNGG